MIASSELIYISMYTSDNPHFNTLDKILLGFVAFSILWLFLKAIADKIDGYGPHGWRWEQLEHDVQENRRRGYKRRRATTPPRGLRKRRIYLSDSDEGSEDTYSSDGYSSDYTSGSHSN